MSENNSNQKKQQFIKRRQFLAWAWGTSMAALGGGMLASLFKFIQPVTAGGFGGLVRAGRVDEFLPGSMSHIKAGRFFLYRLEDGSFLAMWQRCTHLGCSVPWDQAQGQFHCPCHGSLFDRKGEVQGGPAPRPLDVFPVTITNNEVFVDTGSAIQRSQFDPKQTTKA
jgi:cytochrome b6-f complex iron-sulfur subunit